MLKTKTMSDAEYGKLVRVREQRYTLSIKIVQAKAKAAGLVATPAEIDAEMKTPGSIIDKILKR